MCPLYSREIERLNFIRRNDSSPFYFASSIDCDLESEEINKLLSINVKESKVIKNEDNLPKESIKELNSINDLSKLNSNYEISSSSSNNDLNATSSASINLNTDTNIDTSNLSSIYRLQKIKSMLIESTKLNNIKSTKNDKPLLRPSTSNSKSDLRTNTSFDLYNNNIKKLIRSNSCLQQKIETENNISSINFSTSSYRLDSKKPGDDQTAIVELEKLTSQNKDIINNTSNKYVTSYNSNEDLLPNLKSFQMRMDSFFKTRIKDNLKQLGKAQKNLHTTNNSNYNSMSSNSFRSQSYDILLNKQKITNVFPVCDLVIKNSSNRRDQLQTDHRNYTCFSQRKIKSATLNSNLNQTPNTNKIVTKRFVLNRSAQIRNQSASMFNRMLITGRNFKMAEKANK
jgi:hypothetical protein